MQVVDPSVSLAATLHGTAFTVFVEIPSSPTLSKPVVVFGRNAVPETGAAPAVAGGVLTAAGGASAVPVGCCANAGNDNKARAAPTEKVIFAKRIETSFGLLQDENNAAPRKFHRVPVAFCWLLPKTCAPLARIVLIENGLRRRRSSLASHRFEGFLHMDLAAAAFLRRLIFARDQTNYDLMGAATAAVEEATEAPALLSKLCARMGLPAGFGSAVPRPLRAAGAFVEGGSPRAFDAGYRRGIRFNGLGDPFVCC